jgi:hypothetical protein
MLQPSPKHAFTKLKRLSRRKRREEVPWKGPKRVAQGQVTVQRERLGLSLVKPNHYKEGEAPQENIIREKNPYTTNLYSKHPIPKS